MVSHYLKTTWRYLSEHKIFSAINLVGLGCSFCIVYFALLFVNFELSYDKFNTKADRIYRVSTDVENAAGINYETSSGPMAEALQTNFAEVEKTARIFLDYYIVQRDEKFAVEETLAYADSSVFSVFSFPLIKGNASSVLNAPYTMVLSETAAKKYFGTTDCLNKTLQLDGKITATVKGVMKDIPQNSHFRTDIFLSMSSLIQEGTGWNTNWSRFGFSIYVLLKEHATANELKNKLPAFAKDHPLKNNLHYSLSLEPLTSLYLHGKVRGNKAGNTSTGSAANLYIFSAVAVFIVLIACFNFINLTTAFSLKRAKEIGIRKVMGATKNQLVFQFLTDTIVLTLLAFILAVVLCVLLTPLFNQLTAKTISTSIFDNLKYFGLFLSLAVLTGFLSGIYPAFFLSRFKPVVQLKGKFINNSKGSYLRRGLVVTQFTISIVLIVATIIVYSQLNFMQNSQLGFKREHNLVIDYHYDDRITDHVEAIGNELCKIPGIKFSSVSSAIPGRSNTKYLTAIEGVNNERQEFQSDAYRVDYNFIKQYGLEIIAGRDFSKNFVSDLRKSVVINEATVKMLGLATPQEAVGKRFYQRGDTGLIVGVVKDFHFHSLHEEIKPLTMQVSPGFYTFYTLTVSSDNIHTTIKELEKKWATIAPGLPLIYFFADDTFNAQYAADDRFGKLFICFTIMAIFISCLGLLGLTSFNTIQRTKEIGIRKVLGASVMGIVRLLSKEFAGLVGIAFLISIPVAWVGMHYWLTNFAYRITVKFEYFLLGGFIGFTIALIALGYHTVKAAIANPIAALRSE